tara:strand:+ start:765 stop:974 length:210 start_codon:yes stop_codon:yes gene_type:complete
MNRKERRMNERKMKKSLKNDAALIEVAKQNKVYESDTYSPEMMKIASEIRQELARENPDAFLNLLKLVA